MAHPYTMTLFSRRETRSLGTRASVGGLVATVLGEGQKVDTGVVTAIQGHLDFGPRFQATHLIIKTQKWGCRDQHRQKQRHVPVNY